MQSAILYEDDDLLILNKPCGLPTLPGKKETSALDLAIESCPTLQKQDGEYGLLHRLDNDTSGILLFSKSPEEFDRIKALWKTPYIQKLYRAWVRQSETAEPLPKSIHYPIGHSAKSAKKMIAVPTEFFDDRKFLKRIRGIPKPARTQIVEVQTVGQHLDLTLEIQTGMRHQIRCHLATAGYPIVGDTVYRGEPSSRLWLHAWKMKILLKNKKELWIEAPLPKDWQNFSGEAT